MSTRLSLSTPIRAESRPVPSCTPYNLEVGLGGRGVAREPGGSRTLLGSTFGPRLMRIVEGD